MIRLAAMLALIAGPALAGDVDALEACLAGAETGGAHPLSCIGTVEQPCFEGLASPGYAETAECISREAAAWDAILNADWRQLMGELDDETEQPLVREAQRAWIAFRDADCHAALMLAHPVRGGIWGADCERTRTAERVLAIRAMLGDRGQ